MKYKVNVPFNVSIFLDIEADDEDQAVSLANRKAEKYDLHDLINQMEWSGTYELLRYNTDIEKDVIEVSTEEKIAKLEADIKRLQVEGGMKSRHFSGNPRTSTLIERKQREIAILKGL